MFIDHQVAPRWEPVFPVEAKPIHRVPSYVEPGVPQWLSQQRAAFERRANLHYARSMHRLTWTLRGVTAVVAILVLLAVAQLSGWKLPLITALLLILLVGCLGATAVAATAAQGARDAADRGDRNSSVPSADVVL